jgi:hypothetical protein
VDQDNGVGVKQRGLCRDETPSAANRSLILRTPSAASRSRAAVSKAFPVAIDSSPLKSRFSVPLSSSIVACFRCR